MSLGNDRDDVYKRTFLFKSCPIVDPSRRPLIVLLLVLGVFFIFAVTRIGLSIHFAPLTSLPESIAYQQRKSNLG